MQEKESWLRQKSKETFRKKNEKGDRNMKSGQTQRLSKVK